MVGSALGGVPARPDRPPGRRACTIARRGCGDPGARRCAPGPMVRKGRPPMTARPLAVGIDARAASEVAGGRGRYVRELLRALATCPEAADMTFRLYCRTRWDGAALDGRFTWVELPARDPLWHVRVARRATAETAVFLSTNSYLTAWMTRIPTVIVVYDLVAFESPDTAQLRA